MNNYSLYPFLMLIFTLCSYSVPLTRVEKRGRRNPAPNIFNIPQHPFSGQGKKLIFRDFCILHEALFGILWIIPTCNPFAPVLFYRYRNDVKDTHRSCIPNSLSPQPPKKIILILSFARIESGSRDRRKRG